MSSKSRTDLDTYIAEKEKEWEDRYGSVNNFSESKSNVVEFKGSENQEEQQSNQNEDFPNIHIHRSTEQEVINQFFKYLTSFRSGATEPELNKQTFQREAFRLHQLTQNNSCAIH